jgi:serine/threonine-protein kinase
LNNPGQKRAQAERQPGEATSAGTDPAAAEAALLAAEQRLARGESVTLIGPTGPPRWSRVLVGEEPAKLSTARNRPFQIHTLSLCLVELLPDPQRERYRFRVEVRHDDTEKGSVAEVGLFFGYSRQGADHCFAQLAFNERSDKKIMLQGNPIQLRLHSYGEPGPLRDNYAASVSPAFLQPIGGKNVVPEASWHRLEVEVTPDDIRGQWDNKVIGPWTRQKRTVDERLLQRNPTTPLAVRPEVAPRQPLGLYVYWGVAAFRNAVVEPLPDHK